MKGETLKTFVTLGKTPSSEPLKTNDNVVYIKTESILRLNRVLNKLFKNVGPDDLLWWSQTTMKSSDVSA